MPANVRFGSKEINVSLARLKTYVSGIFITRVATFKLCITFVLISMQPWQFSEENFSCLLNKVLNFLTQANTEQKEKKMAPMMLVEVKLKLSAALDQQTHITRKSMAEKTVQTPEKAMSPRT